MLKLVSSHSKFKNNCTNFTNFKTYFKKIQSTFEINLQAYFFKFVI